MSRLILKAANFIINFIVICVLFIAGIYAVYALWDNQQVYADAENVQENLMQMKPEIAEDGGASFEELLAINPDVVAWITMDHTNIDYPVLQGETNLTYINTNVYGEFALAGSIFLDSRCDRTFQDAYSLLYGHHMANSGMFGDLDLYKEEAFFKENKAGKLILPDQSYDLEIMACLVVASSEDIIFDTELAQDDIDSLLAFVEQNALHLRTETMEAIREKDIKQQILALSTCSSEYTDARTVIITVMKPCTAVD